MTLQELSRKEAEKYIQEGYKKEYEITYIKGEYPIQLNKYNEYNEAVERIFILAYCISPSKCNIEITKVSDFRSDGCYAKKEVIEKKNITYTN